MTRNRSRALARCIGQALWRARLTSVVADVDGAGICYLSGQVDSALQEARAVELAWAGGVRHVESALDWPGRQPRSGRLARLSVARMPSNQWLPSRAARALRDAQRRREAAADERDEGSGQTPSGAPWQPSRT